MTLLLLNLLHGTIALAWVVALRRSGAPLAPRTAAGLLTLAVGLPPVVLLAQRLWPVPDRWAVMRLDLWQELLGVAGWPLFASLLLLLAGTSAIFLLQELLPALRRRRALVGPRVLDSRLEASAERVWGAVLARTKRPRRDRPRPVVRCLEVARPLAALSGFLRPEVLVSRGLLAHLDDEELDGVVAHELAHLLHGGNLWPLVLWLLRVPQAANPAALILFRQLMELREAACDATAAELTRRPAALAAVLLKLQGRPPPEAGSGWLERARGEVLRRAGVAATRARVERLLEPQALPARLGTLLPVAAVLLGALLWSVGPTRIPAP